MFDTKSLSFDLVKHSQVPTSLSTSEVRDARYLTVNAGYLTLVERVWKELDGECLVAKGSAISNPERDRRLWLLDRQGFYDREKAVIGGASGRLIPVVISAQRIWCSGVACDLEFFQPVAPQTAPATEPALTTAIAPRAAFLPELAVSLGQLSSLNRTILMRRMLSSVAEGAVMVGQLTTNRSVQRYSKAVRDRLLPYISVTNPAAKKTLFDFSTLDGTAAERHLLEMAGEIWSLIHFARDPEIRALLKRLVEPYTRATLRVISS